MVGSLFDGVRYCVSGDALRVLLREYHINRNTLARAAAVTVLVDGDGAPMMDIVPLVRFLSLFLLMLLCVFRAY